MKLQITGLQLAGVLSAAIASGLYDPASKQGVGHADGAQSCMCWTIYVLPDGIVSDELGHDVRQVIKGAMQSDEDCALLRTYLQKQVWVGSNLLVIASGLVRWYAALILWGVQYGDKGIDLSQVPRLRFNREGQVYVHD